MLGNSVEVADFNPGEKMPPLIRGKLTERPFRAIGIADQDRFPPARYLDARPSVAGTRNAPGQILCLRTIHIHKRSFHFIRYRNLRSQHGYRPT